MHDEWIDEIAGQWDGCMYDAGPGGEIDIGAAIRSAWDKRKALQALPQPAPSVQIRCPARLKNGGVCPHHNLQCGWPACNKEAP